MHIASESTVKAALSLPTDTGALTSELLLEIAERAQSFTEATGVAIALADGEEMVCRASCGTSVPEPGSKMRTEGSFTGLCVSSGETLRCQDAHSDPRVNAAACQALGIRSIVVVPLRGQHKVVGVLAVFAKTAQAFSGTHVSILQTLGEVIEALLRDATGAASNREPQAVESPSPTPMRLTQALRRAAQEDTPAASAMHNISPNSGGEDSAVVVESKPPVAKKAIQPPATVAAPPPPRPMPRVVPIEPVREPAVFVEPDEPAIHEPVLPVAEALEPIRYVHPLSKAGEGEQVLFISGKAKPKSGVNMMVVGAVLGVAALLAVGGWVLHLRTSDGVEASASPPMAEPAANLQTAVAPNSGAVVQQQQPVPAPQQAITPRTAAPLATSPVAKPTREPEITEPEPRAVAPVVVVNDLPQGLRGPAGNQGEEEPDAPALTMANSSLPELSRPITMPIAGPPASKLVPGKLIHRVMPQYPEIAKRLRLEGVVTLHAVVSPEGTVGDVKVVGGNTLLHNAALAAVKQWRYTPSSLNGKPVESTVEIRLTFQHPK